MSRDSFTEVNKHSWFGRLRGAFKGILFGLLMVLAAVVVLFWNEGRAVERHKTLKEGAGAVVPVPADAVDAAHEGDLVHLSGRAETTQTLRDDTFGITADALRLERRVEMYQWKESKESETRKELGGGTESTTTYSYTTEWANEAIDSSRFREPDGHLNPGSMPWEGRDWVAAPVTLGAFRLDEGLVRRIDRWNELAVTSVEGLPEDLRQRARIEGSGYYLGKGAPDSPTIGDVQVHFRVVEPTEVSVVAQQAGAGFRPFQTHAGGTVELLELGAVPADAMFQAAQRRNTFLTWILRLVGFLVMALGFRKMLRPLAVLADVVPMIGNLVGAGASVVAMLLAGFLSLATIAIAWIVYRPLLGLLLAAAAVAAIVWLVRRVRHTRATASAGGRGTAPPPPPPPAATPPPPPPLPVAGG